MATKNKWNYKTAILFASGIIICLLGYLNSIPFVFVGTCYAIFVIVNQYKAREVSGKLAIKITVLSIVIILAFTLPLYIRNYYLYHDFTGASAFNDAYQRWLGSGGNQTMAPYGGSIIKMMLNSGWVVTTFKSSVSLFGYMNVSTKLGYYIFYLLFLYTGILFKVVFPNKVKFSSTRKLKIIFDFLMFVGIVFTLFLSLYRSATTDFQPQGRYILTIFPIVVIWWIEGINRFIMILDNKIKTSCYVYVPVIFYAAVSLWCVLRYVILNSLLVG